MSVSIQSLLSAQFVVLAALAMLFVVVPQATIKTLGLPPAPSFWPRMLGALCGGLVAGLIATDQGWTKSGLGLGGLIAIDLTLVFAVVSMLVVGAPLPTRRGKAFLILLAITLALIAFTGIAIAT